jgi:exonuclease VII small subunit
MSLASIEKQKIHLDSEIEKYEEAVSQFKIGVEKSQQQYRECHQELVQTQQQVRDLKIVIATSEGNHRETLEVVSEKSKENAFLKNELSKLKHSNESMMDQVDDDFIFFFQKFFDK